MSFLSSRLENGYIENGTDKGVGLSQGFCQATHAVSRLVCGTTVLFFCVKEVVMGRSLFGRSWNHIIWSIGLCKVALDIVRTFARNTFERQDGRVAEKIHRKKPKWLFAPIPGWIGIPLRTLGIFKNLKEPCAV